MERVNKLIPMVELKGHWSCLLHSLLNTKTSDRAFDRFQIFTRSPSFIKIQIRASLHAPGGQCNEHEELTLGLGFVTPQKGKNRRQAALSEQTIPEEGEGAPMNTAEQEIVHIKMLTEAVKHLEDENTLIKKVVGRELIDLKDQLAEAKTEHERLVMANNKRASTSIASETEDLSNVDYVNANGKTRRRSHQYTNQPFRE
eukprot:jgi/Bigna1/85174/estExt_fgenesh1_pg.C_20367